jgi:hypothetical protein
MDDYKHLRCKVISNIYRGKLRHRFHRENYTNGNLLIANSYQNV